MLSSLRSRCAQWLNKLPIITNSYCSMQFEVRCNCTIWYLSSSQSQIFRRVVWPTMMVNLGRLSTGGDGGFRGDGGNDYSLLCANAGPCVMQGPLAQCLLTSEWLKGYALLYPIYSGWTWGWANLYIWRNFCFFGVMALDETCSASVSQWPGFTLYSWVEGKWKIMTHCNACVSEAMERRPDTVTRHSKLSVLWSSVQRSSQKM